MRKNSTSRRQLRIAKIIKKEVSNLLQRQFFYEYIKEDDIIQAFEIV